MRSKAPLALMEQMIMLLVFALAAALCVQAFVKSDSISTRSEARDRAALAAQSAAETIKYIGGDTENALSGAAKQLNGKYESDLLLINYDKNWNITNDKPAYELTAEGVNADVPGMQKAVVKVNAYDGSGGTDTIFEINTAWQETLVQEVNPNE